MKLIKLLDMGEGQLQLQNFLYMHAEVVFENVCPLMISTSLCFSMHTYL